MLSAMDAQRICQSKSAYYAISDQRALFSVLSWHNTFVIERFYYIVGIVSFVFCAISVWYCTARSMQHGEIIDK